MLLPNPHTPSWKFFFYWVSSESGQKQNCLVRSSREPLYKSNKASPLGIQLWKNPYMAARLDQEYGLSFFKGNIELEGRGWDKEKLMENSSRFWQALVNSKRSEKADTIFISIFFALWESEFLELLTLSFLLILLTLLYKDTF